MEVEEAEEKLEKARATKILVDQVVANVEELQRLEGVWRPAMSKVVVPCPIGAILSSELMAQQIASEVAQKQVIIPKAPGSGLVTNMASDLELDDPKDYLHCVCQGWRCTWELRGKDKSCIPCQDNKQRCEPVRAGGAHPPLNRIMEELEDVEGAPKWKLAQVVGNSSELVELNKTLNKVSEGI